MKRLIFTLVFCLFGASFLSAQEAPSLVERLGFSPDARLLIINVDDFGMCHSANMGTLRGFKANGVSSATVMTCCPWFLEAAKMCKENSEFNVGVHTVLTSEWNVYKWGPVLGWKTVPSLCTDMGYFHKDIVPIYLSAKPEEADREVRAQIDRALQAGIDITHIDSHMGAMQYDQRFLEVYAKIARDYNLPCRMPSRAFLEKLLGKGDVMDLFDKHGVLHPDELVLGGPKKPEETETWWKKAIENQPKGTVMELYIHSADDSEEMKMFTGSQRQRYADTEFFSDPATVQWIKDQGIKLISYKELRDLQQAEKP